MYEDRGARTRDSHSTGRAGPHSPLSCMHNNLAAHFGLVMAAPGGGAWAWGQLPCSCSPARSQRAQGNRAADAQGPCSCPTVSCTASGQLLNTTSTFGGRPGGRGPHVWALSLLFFAWGGAVDSVSWCHRLAVGGWRNRDSQPPVNSQGRAVRVGLGVARLSVGLHVSC